MGSSNSTVNHDDEWILREIRDAPPAHYLLKLESFSLFRQSGVQKYESGEFKVGDYKWKIIFYPNGNISSGGQGYISIYLELVSGTLPSGIDVNAIFTFFLFDQLRGKYLTVQGQVRRFDKVKSEWGFSKFISLEAFKEASNGYLVGDTCFFGVEIFVINNSRLGETLSMSTYNNLSHKHEWKIPQFSKLEESCFSDIFTVGGYDWKLKLHPQGNTTNKDCNLSLFLLFADSNNPSSLADQKVKVEYTITLKDQINQKHKQLTASTFFDSNNKGWGWDSFIPLRDVKDSEKGFLVLDCCIIEVEVKVAAAIRRSTLVR